MKKKINLDELKVKSFTTSYGVKMKDLLKAGGSCPSAFETLAPGMAGYPNENGQLGYACY